MRAFLIAAAVAAVVGGLLALSATHAALYGDLVGVEEGGTDVDGC